MSLIEVVIVMVIVVILGGVAVVGYRAVAGDTKASATTNVLRGVAANEEAAFRSRGAFVAGDGTLDATETAALNRLTNLSAQGAAAGWAGPSEDSAAPAKGTGAVSVAATGTGTAAQVGLAARDANGVCHAVVVYAPTKTTSPRGMVEGTLSSATCSATAALAAAGTLAPAK